MRTNVSRSAERRPGATNPVAERMPQLAKTVGGVGLSVAAGAGVEYLLDPDRGRARRAKARDKLTHGTHRTRGGLEVLTHDLAHRSSGALAAARYRLAGRDADDRIVYERARETLGQYLNHPHAVEVAVANGVVTLTGDVPVGEDQRTLRALKRVPGITEVEPRWSAGLDPADVPSLQGATRQRGRIPGPLKENWSPTTRLMVGSGGVALSALAGRLPGPLRWGLRGTGALFAARAVTNKPMKRLTGIRAGRRAVTVTDGISVAAAPAQVWSLISDYGMFMYLLPDVWRIRFADDAISHWEITGPAGVPIRFQAEETNRVEGREIAWKTQTAFRRHARVTLRPPAQPLRGSIGRLVL